MMNSPHLPEPSLLKKVLEPLLEDFQYWFDRSRKLLESETIEFLGEERQNDLLDRVVRAQEEVSSAKMLLEATGCQAGVDMSVLMPWHRLLTECWQVSMRLRSERSQMLTASLPDSNPTQFTDRSSTQLTDRDENANL